eukprot:scaffold7526_cov115-Skeletonema_dohrnii-CCMP3373.AAC.7
MANGIYKSAVNVVLSIALPLLLHIVRSLLLISIAYTSLVTLYFLGYFRLQVPSTFLTRGGNDDDGGTSSSSVEREKSCHTSSGCSTCSSSLWLFNCQHNQHQYLCFPPYCAPGGLRSRLFPTAAASYTSLSFDAGISIQEQQTNDNNSNDNETQTAYHTTNSSTPNNPLDLVLQNPYILPLLPSVVKKALQDCRDDWDTLGGSRCSFVRNSLLATKRSQQQQHQKQQVGIDNKDSSCSHVEKEQEVAENSVESSFWKRVNQVAVELDQAETEADQQLIDSHQRQQEYHHHQSVSRDHESENKKHSNSNIIIKMTATDPPASTPTSVHETTTTTESNGSSNNNVLPQAILVYHESAHSIVFRDHLRRQQGAIRRTSSIMEQQNSVRRASSQSPSRLYHKEHSEPIVGSGGDATTTTAAAGMSRATSTIDEVSETDEAGGYESGGSTKSNRSSRSQSSNTTVKSGEYDANSSVASGGSSRSGSRKMYLRNKAKSSLPPLRKMSSPSPPPPSTSAPSPPPPPSISSVVVANFQPVIEPLEALDLNSKHVFEPLFDADPFLGGEEDGLPGLTKAECEVVEMLKSEKAVVKTVRNQDWTSFLNKFKPEGDEGKGERLPGPGERRKKGDDDPKGGDSSGETHPFNSFVTSTSLLPSCAKKMRCFGSTNEYATGAVFALPASFPNDASEDDAAKRTRTWSWPSGYSAKTEFNIDHRGNLINGREEALVPLSRMRQMNHSYLHDTDYVVGGRMVKGGLQVSEKATLIV